MEKISTRQLYWLVLGFLIGTSIIITPGVEFAAQDTWVSETIALFIGLIMCFLISKFYLAGEDMTFLEFNQRIFGNIISSILIIIYLMFSIFLCSLVVRNIGDLMTTTIHPETPIEIFNIVIVLVSAYGIKKGIETISRTFEILMPLVIMLSLILIALLATEVNLDFLMPVLSQDAISIFKGSLVISAFPYTETVVFLFLMPHIGEVKKAGKGVLWAIIYGGVLLIMRPIFSVGIFGPTEAAKIIFPLHVATRQIMIGEFLERLEIIMLFIWISTTFIKITVLYYVSVKGLSDLFLINDHRILVIPVGLIIATLSIINYDNILQEFVVAQRVWPLISIPIGLLLPSLTLLIFSIKQRIT